jgi:hypothetical protein
MTQCTWVLREVNKHGLLLAEQLCFWLTLYNAASGRFVENINRDYDEKGITYSNFVNVAKTFDTIWVKGFLHKINILNFP